MTGAAKSATILTSAASPIATAAPTTRSRRNSATAATAPSATYTSLCAPFTTEIHTMGWSPTSTTTAARFAVRAAIQTHANIAMATGIWNPSRSPRRSVPASRLTIAETAVNKGPYALGVCCQVPPTSRNTGSPRNWAGNAWYGFTW